MKKWYIALHLLALAILLGISSCADDIGFRSSETAAADGGTGIAGSYARFLTIGDYLYIVDIDGIQTFSLSDPSLPVKIDDQTIGEQIESIFHHNGNLFIGSGSGLFIYQIQSDGIPTKKSEYSYDFPVLPCDPVVANDTYAYVTLHTRNDSSPCGLFATINELRIFNITDIENPELLVTYPMFNPKGVGLDGTTLFVCDDEDGLKIFDAADPFNLIQLQHFTDIQAFDVIPLGDLALVVAPDNVYQIDYSDLADIKELSRIPILP